MKKVYPVIFTDVSTNILIEVPDLKILTEANEEGKEKASFAEAIIIARDAIGPVSYTHLRPGHIGAPELFRRHRRRFEGRRAGQGKQLLGSHVSSTMGSYG